MTLSQHIGFIIGYIFLLAITVGFAASFISFEDKFLVKLEEIEDSVVANRVVKCFSKDSDFGVVDITKINGEVLSKCMGEKYLLNVKLRKIDGDNVFIENFNLRKSRIVNRYVVADGKTAKLEVDYSKDEL